MAANERSQYRLALLGGLETVRLRLNVFDVGREVGGNVRQQVASLTKAIGHDLERRIMRRRAFKCGPRARDQPDRVGYVVAGWVSEQAGVC